MKYRSPSPDSVLPTPPQSPTSHELAHPAISLLESLEAFYQQERYWVHHTRAALELALTKGIDAPPSNLSNTPSPCPSLGPVAPLSPASSVSSDATPTAVVKMEPELTPPTLSRPDATRWMRRKNIMRLKLDGVTSHSRKRHPHRAPPSEPGAQLLEMFSELMDARMESCQRVQRMVRNANRADLHMR
ncbi:hypothetical protein GSI_00894 [Ganoderma sinense ZZ0214-1]|uniref:Uncharacterized protein n=1 Tax=Ganoderma sinense ZZ0214-1 TaxID=1077348 RepID=A0A2G8STU6_9APHY|nr:hypothetical protein GSI_00894 [Ganoderma sinense ZZ0214-1]